MMFCGEAMGEAAPPMFEASAMPRMRALEKSESLGRFRSKGCQSISTLCERIASLDCTCMIEKHKTGAATLLIHILATNATNILVSKTVRGRVPALLRTKVAISFAIEYFERAAARVKPPSSSMMTGVHMAANTYFVALLASSRRCDSSERTTRRMTARNGTRSPVTNSGITLYH